MPLRGTAATPRGETDLGGSMHVTVHLGCMLATRKGLWGRSSDILPALVSAHGLLGLVM